MNDVLTAILESDFGLVAGTVAIAWILRPVLLHWMENIREQEQIEKEQTKALRDLQDELRTVRDERASDREVSRSLTAALAQINQTLTAARTQMVDVSGRRDQKLEAIHTDVKGTPGAVWLAGEDALKGVRVTIEQTIAGLERRILERVDPSAVNAHLAVQNELRTLRERFDHNMDDVLGRLEDIGRAVRLLRDEKADIAAPSAGETAGVEINGE